MRSRGASRASVVRARAPARGVGGRGESLRGPPAPRAELAATVLHRFFFSSLTFLSSTVAFLGAPVTVPESPPRRLLPGGRGRSRRGGGVGRIGGSLGSRTATVTGPGATGSPCELGELGKGASRGRREGDPFPKPRRGVKMPRSDGFRNAQVTHPATFLDLSSGSSTAVPWLILGPAGGVYATRASGRVGKPRAKSKKFRVFKIQHACERITFEFKMLHSFQLQVGSS